MSFAPFLQNECKFTKVKRERNASYIQRYLFATNKSYRFVFSVPKSIKYIYMSQCEMGVEVKKCTLNSSAKNYISGWSEDHTKRR